MILILSILCSTSFLKCTKWSTRASVKQTQLSLLVVCGKMHISIKLLPISSTTLFMVFSVMCIIVSLTFF